ncbi:MAG: extracellular solute-binding protein [Lachnospiraceae bacterium]|nr:extracellular solute-binding protein [Lachnospiraceae bacterium]
MVKKLAAASMAAALTVSLLAGCGGSGGGSTLGELNEDTGQTDFKVFSAMSALSGGYDDNVVLNDMMDKAGIKIDWETQSDSISEQVNIRIAGNELPDAFQGVGFTNYELTNYGGDGTFIDLTPYMTEEYMPNLAKILEDNPDIKEAITMEDGGIYGLPAAEQMGTGAVGDDENYSIFSVPQFSMINKAWLDELGLEVPTTLDELHDCLKAFKENDMSAKMYGNDKGTTIPMCTGYDQWCWGQNVFYAGFGFTNWTNDIIDDLVVGKDGKVNFVCDDDNYRKAISYFHDWFDEGLMDPEMFSQDDTQLISKCQQGYVGVSTWWYIEELMGDHAKDYVFLPILDGPDVTHNVNLRDGGATNSGQLSVTSACESPINLLKFYDQWYEPENVMQLQYGPIDVYFTEKNDDGLWLSITEEEAQEKFGKGAGELKSAYEVAGPKLILTDYYTNTFKMEDRAIERLTDLKDYWMPQVDDTTVYPQDMVFTNDELDTIDMYKTDFENSISEFEARCIKEGAPTDEEWESYVSQLNDSCGMEELLSVYQDAYDRYQEDLGE